MNKTLLEMFKDVEKRSQVWEKGELIGYDPEDGEEVRTDAYGSPMKRGHYGRTDSDYGWEIDHIIPVKLGGTDDLRNLQPLQWENNRRKSGNFPVRGNFAAGRR